MGRNVRIIDEGDWFLGRDGQQNYPISYRYVICHALLFVLSENDFNRRDAFEKLKDLDDSIKHKETSSETGFLDVFVLQDGWGFVVVDQTGGIYPLVLYSDNREKYDAEERVSAFQRALKDVIENFDSICSYFEERNARPRDWDQEFQEDLFEEAGFTGRGTPR